MIFKCLACLIKEKNISKVLLASLITHTNSENFSESRIRFLLRLFRISGGFRNNFYGHRWLSESRNQLSKRVIRTIFTIRKQFQRSSRNFILNILPKTTAKNCRNHHHSLKSSVLSFLRSSKEYSSRDSFYYCNTAQKQLQSHSQLPSQLPLKVHKIEIFFGFDFEICIISLLVMSKY